MPACHNASGKAHAAALRFRHHIGRNYIYMDHDYSFAGKIDSNSRLYEAWRTAMDVRKFEIELYWKRATYFWTFIGLALAGYGAILTSKQDSLSASMRSDVLFGIANVGLVFSIAWYFVNRGSKFWQKNWEFQVDILESKVIGPLYKTVFADKDTHFLDLTSAYPFSVSNINHILSLFVVLLFALLAVYAIPCFELSTTCGPSAPKISIGVLTVIFSYLLFHFGRTSSMRTAQTLDATKIKQALADVRYSVRKIDIHE
jgi:hypothetical protein